MHSRISRVKGLTFNPKERLFRRKISSAECWKSDYSFSVSATKYKKPRHSIFIKPHLLTFSSSDLSISRSWWNLTPKYRKFKHIASGTINYIWANNITCPTTIKLTSLLSTPLLFLKTRIECDRNASLNPIIRWWVWYHFRYQVSLP